MRSFGTRRLSILALLVASGCTTVDIAHDKPAHTYLSSKSPDAMRDCILQSGNPSEFGHLKVLPYRGGWMISYDNGIAVPNVLFVFEITPRDSGSQLDVLNTRILPSGADYIGKKYTEPCVLG